METKRCDICGTEVKVGDLKEHGRLRVCRFCWEDLNWFKGR